MQAVRLVNYLLVIFVSLLAWLPVGAYAGCNNPQNWFEAPKADIKIFLGYKQEGQENLGGDSGGAPARSYPLVLPKELLEKSGSGKLSDDETSNISFFEPDGKGQWRVCRIESWWPVNSGDNEAERARRREVTKRYVSRNAILAKIKPGYMAVRAILYDYDDKGRIVKVAEGNFETPDVPAKIKMCRRYDNKDRIILEVNPKYSKFCPSGEPNIRDSWRRYKYADLSGKEILLLSLLHSGREDGSWEEKSSPFRTGPSLDAPWGNADVDSEKGVTLIFGSNLGKLDDNAANTVVDSHGGWNGSTYVFTTPPVPVSVLEHPDQIYKYNRRRQTYIDGQIVKLFEFFKANEHISRDRYYMIDGYVLRHEQLDAKGKLVRVITIEDWKQPRPGPKPDIDDRLLTAHEPALLSHQVFHRVYDIDAAGKPVLVAVSWNRPIRINPTKKVSIDYADFVFGTPDGKSR